MALILVGIDYATYAATGSSLLLGKSNAAGTVTTITNTNGTVAAGAVLRLVTRSSTYPPFTTNAKGLVANLFAARASNADRLGGLTLAQVEAGATKLNGQTANQLATTIGGFTFDRSGVVLGPVTKGSSGYDPAYASGNVKVAGTYLVGGDIVFSCDPRSPSNYDVRVFATDFVSPESWVLLTTVPASQCGQKMTIPPAVFTINTGQVLMVTVDDVPYVLPPTPVPYDATVTFHLVGVSGFTNY